MNLQENIRRIIREEAGLNPENTFDFIVDGGQETHQYQVETVTDSTKLVPVEKTNLRGEKKTFNTKVITMKWLNPPSNLPNAEGLTIVKVCGNTNIKAPRGYSQLPDEFIKYANGLC